jgi:hypothetical protein
MNLSKEADLKFKRWMNHNNAVLLGLYDYWKFVSGLEEMNSEERVYFFIIFFSRIQTLMLWFFVSDAGSSFWEISSEERLCFFLHGPNLFRSTPPWAV